MSLGPWRTRIPGYPGFETPLTDWSARIAFRFVRERRWWNQINTMILDDNVAVCGENGRDDVAGVGAIGIDELKPSMMSRILSCVESIEERISFNLVCKP